MPLKRTTCTHQIKSKQGSFPPLKVNAAGAILSHAIHCLLFQVHPLNTITKIFLYFLSSSPFFFPSAPSSSFTSTRKDLLILYHLN
jgi:hypothetical protein